MQISVDGGLVGFHDLSSALHSCCCWHAQIHKLRRKASVLQRFKPILHSLFSHIRHHMQHSEQSPVSFFGHLSSHLFTHICGLWGPGYTWKNTMIKIPQSHLHYLLCTVEISCRKITPDHRPGAELHMKAKLGTVWAKWQHKIKPRANNADTT